MPDKILSRLRKTSRGDLGLTPSPRESEHLPLLSTIDNPDIMASTLSLIHNNLKSPHPPSPWRQEGSKEERAVGDWSGEGRVSSRGAELGSGGSRPKAKVSRQKRTLPYKG